MQIMVLDVEFEPKWLEEGRGGGRGHASTQARMAHRFRVGDVGRAYPPSEEVDFVCERSEDGDHNHIKDILLQTGKTTKDPCWVLHHVVHLVEAP